MAEKTSVRARGLRVKDYGPTMHETSRRTRWIVSSSSPKSAEELTFTTRLENGNFCWWHVTPPKTTYWHVHQMLGRAYAFEVLDLINNPATPDESRNCLRFILQAIATWLPTVQNSAASGMADGFFEVVDEYVSTGTANR